MSELHIVKYPDPVLRKKAAPVERVTPELQEFMRRMADLMYASSGVGLAAPQVGVSLRIIVVDADDRLQMLVNPRIIERDGSQTGVEGCLSLPDLHGDVTCAERVVVNALDSRGKKVTLRGEGLWARAMQHEIDHLDGTLFIDHVIPDSLFWVVREPGEDGGVSERPTSLEDALRQFERQAALLKA
jgi:peptide deformylase